MFPDNIATVAGIINALGILAFAYSGAIAAMKKEADLIGILFVSLAACSAGGITRDLLMGDLPPELLRSHFSLLMAVIATVSTYFFYNKIDKLARPIDIFDALGLGIFAVVGANKGLAFGLTPIWSIGVGVITGVGGGVLRDMMLAQVPTIFKSEIYATAAIIGASILVFGRLIFPDYRAVFLIAGALVCSGIRLLAIHYHWHVRR